MKIRFIGALGSVTGSCSLFTHQGRYYLVDCGSSQGNDANNGGEGSFPFKPGGLAGVFLTHAHLDHCGMLPELVRQGFNGDVYCTRATADLTRIALTDAANLPTSGFSPADVAKIKFLCLDEFPEFQFGRFQGITHNLSVALIRTAHILGSVGFEFQFSGGLAKKTAWHRTIVFSGDIGCNIDGNCYQSLLNARQYPSTHAEFLVCESTYGARNRGTRFASFTERIQALRNLLEDATSFGQGATIIFPCFTLQRLQDLLVDLHCLLEMTREKTGLGETSSPGVPFGSHPVDVMVDSPLAEKYGEVYVREIQRARVNGKLSYQNPELAERLNQNRENLSTLLAQLLGGCQRQTNFKNYLLSFGTTNSLKPSGLRIILAGSGMCTGGRVMEHLKRCLPMENTTVVITGYQGYGSPGSELMKRAINPHANIDGSPWKLASDEIKARVVDLSGFFSGHADRSGLLDYICHKQTHQTYQNLKRVFLVHGDNAARTELHRAIEQIQRQNLPSNRIVERVELPDPAGPWFDLVHEKWVWEYHSKVEQVDRAVVSGFGRLQILEKMVQSFCEKSPNAVSLDEMIDQLNRAKSHLASAGVRPSPS